MVVRSKVAPSLVAIRRDLEEIDRALVLLVAARVEAAGTAIRLRSQGNGRIADPAQEERVIARAEGWAEQAGLSSGPNADDLPRGRRIREGTLRHRKWARSSPDQVEANAADGSDAGPFLLGSGPAFPTSVERAIAKVRGRTAFTLVSLEAGGILYGGRSTGGSERNLCAASFVVAFRRSSSAVERPTPSRVARVAREALRG